MKRTTATRIVPAFSTPTRTESKKVKRFRALLVQREALTARVTILDNRITAARARLEARLATRAERLDRLNARVKRLNLLMRAIQGTMTGTETGAIRRLERASWGQAVRLWVS